MYKQIVLKKYASIVYMLPFFFLGLLALACLEWLTLSGFLYTVCQLALLLLTALGMYSGYLKSCAQFSYYFFSDELIFKLIGKHATHPLKTVRMDCVRAIYPIDEREKRYRKLRCHCNYSSSLLHKGKYYLVFQEEGGKPAKLCFEPDKTMLSHLKERRPELFA